MKVGSDETRVNIPLSNSERRMQSLCVRKQASFLAEETNYAVVSVKYEIVQSIQSKYLLSILMNSKVVPALKFLHETSRGKCFSNIPPHFAEKSIKRLGILSITVCFQKKIVPSPNNEPINSKLVRKSGDWFCIKNFNSSLSIRPLVLSIPAPFENLSSTIGFSSRYLLISLPCSYLASIKYIGERFFFTLKKCPAIQPRFSLPNRCRVAHKQYCR